MRSNDFFTVCGVENGPSVNPSASINSGAAGIWLLFSATVTREHDPRYMAQLGHQMRGRAVGKDVEAAAQRVLAFTAIRVSLGSTGGISKPAAWRGKAARSALGSTLCRISRKPV